MSREISWSFGIGDPTVAGWTITIGYFIAALTSYMAYLFCRRKNQVATDLELTTIQLIALPYFWIYCCITLVILGLNKQLDLQTLLLEIFRGDDTTDTLNPDNHVGKKSFIILFSAAAVFGYLTLEAVRTNVMSEIKIALGSMSLLLIYIVFRASVIHQFTGAVQSESILAELLLMTEPLGISLFTLSAARAFFAYKKSTNASMAESDSVH